MLLSADHGNSDQMIYGNGLPHTSHTGFPVPLVVYHEKLQDVPFTLGGEKSEFALKDIAPTLLYVMGLSIPPDFTGKPVFK
jgi:2,3-bisphosphoglycerate-independent phosphoglycerate mutase